MAVDQYNIDLLWADWVNAATNQSNNVMETINEAYKWYEKYYAITYGLTPTQILALPGFSGRTTADLAAIAACFQVFQDLYNLMNNVSAPAQANRVGYLAPFMS